MNIFPGLIVLFWGLILVSMGCALEEKTMKIWGFAETICGACLVLIKVFLM